MFVAVQEIVFRTIFIESWSRVNEMYHIVVYLFDDAAAAIAISEISKCVVLQKKKMYITYFDFSLSNRQVY